MGSKIAYLKLLAVCVLLLLNISEGYANSMPSDPVISGVDKHRVINVAADTARNVFGIEGVEFLAGDSSYTKSIDTTFTLHGMKMLPDSLLLSYDHVLDHFSMWGKCKVKILKDTLALNAGSLHDPGIKIDKNDLVDVQFALVDTFGIFGMKFAPKGLYLGWADESQENIYYFFGFAETKISRDTIRFNFGDSLNYGVTMQNGEIKEFDLSITSDFKIAGSRIKPQDLGVEWNSSDSLIQIFGGAEFELKAAPNNPDSSISNPVPRDTSSVKRAMLGISFGDSSSPGVVFKGKEFVSFEAQIIGDFELDSMKIIPEPLAISYAPGVLSIYGGANFIHHAAPDTFAVAFGNSPEDGILLENGHLRQLSLSVTKDIKFSDSTYVEAKDITFFWDMDSSKFVLYGDCVVHLKNTIIDANLGDFESPGIVLDKKGFENINIGLTGNFNLKAMEILPRDLTFQWNIADKREEVFGSALIKTQAGDTVMVALGDTDDPGLLFENAHIKSLNAAITDDFIMRGLEIYAKDLGMSWNKDRFEIYGDAKLLFSNDTVDVNMGQPGDPGMEFYEGSLDNLNIDITSDINLGDFHVKTRDLGIAFNKENEIFSLSGEVELEAIYSLIADLGRDGIEIDVSQSPDRLKIEALTVEVKHGDLGSIDFKDLKVKFNREGVEDVALSVSAPPGIELAADVSFNENPFSLSGVSVAFEAEQLEDAIEIGTTGMAIAKADLTLANLHDPAKFSLEGDLDLTFGGPVSIDGYTAAMAELGTSVSYTHTDLKLGAAANVIAYKEDGAWHGLAGEGTAGIDIEFGKRTTLTLDVVIPRSKVVELDGRFSVDHNKDINALLDVGLYAPRFIPFVGGHEFGSVDGAFRWMNQDPYDSYAAGWLKYHILWHRGEIGVKHNFATGRTSKIGAGSINAIRQEVSRTSRMMKRSDGSVETVSYQNIAHSFKISDPYHKMIILETDWGMNVDSAYVFMTGPEGIYDIARIDLIESTLNEDTLKFDETHHYSFVENDSSVTLVLSAVQPQVGTAVASNCLVPGEYNFIFSYPYNKYQIDSLDLAIHSIYQKPEGSISVAKSDSISGRYDLELDYFTYHHDSCTVNSYWNDTLAYNGRLIDSEILFTDSSSGYGHADVSVMPEHLSEEEELYFYAIIEDGVNPPYATNFSQKFIHENPVTGSVYILKNGELVPAVGIMAFLDETEDGYFNTMADSIPEHCDITDSSGFFEFNESIQRADQIDVVVPYGYSIDESSPDTLPYILSPSGSKEHITLYLKEN